MSEARGKGMLCPVCSVVLVMTERQGVEIDYCPTCRGVWLDRGELDKIIERAAAEERPAGGSWNQPAPTVTQPTPPSPWTAPDSYRSSGHNYDDDDHHRYEPRKQKRRSWLGDLFD